MNITGERVTVKRLCARQVLDSRAFPTVCATALLSNGATGSAMVPSGASTGAHEAHELRDGGDSYLGKGVLQAVTAVNGELTDAVAGRDAYDQPLLDGLLIDRDGSENKSRLGANALLAASLAMARAAANSLQLPLYRYVGGANARVLPRPMMNVLNGGKHANNGLSVQEFMIVPTGANDFSTAVEHCVRVYHALKGLLIKKNLSTGLGDEGGFAPSLDSDAAAIELLLEAADDAGLLGQISIALDAASSEFFDGSAYRLQNETLSACGMIGHWEALAKKYPIISIEDGLAEDDFDGWATLTQRLGNKIQLVGDDLFATNAQRLKKGIELRAANAILVKVNQIGTLTEAMDAVRLAQKAGYNAVISHRSGETEDTTIADLAVALNCGQIKTGAPARSERTAKYNRLLEIDLELGRHAVWGLAC